MKTHRFDAFSFCCVCNQNFFNRKSIKPRRATNAKFMAFAKNIKNERCMYIMQLCLAKQI